MKIKGLDGMTTERLKFEVQHGGRFVIFEYCISIVVLSFKRVSGIHFIKAEESALKKGAAFSLISLLCGWWGIPWGPIWTISTVVTNSRGGRDITPQVLQALSAKAA